MSDSIYPGAASAGRLSRVPNGWTTGPDGHVCLARGTALVERQIDVASQIMAESQASGSFAWRFMTIDQPTSIAGSSRQRHRMALLLSPRPMLAATDQVAVEVAGLFSRIPAEP